MIKSLKIENFKGFSELTLPCLKRITLLGGANNVGKSSVLESVFLLYSSRQQNFFIKQYRLRDVLGGDSWSEFFYNLNTDKTMRISVNDEDNQYTLKCSIKKGFHRDIGKNVQQIVLPNPGGNATAEITELGHGYSTVDSTSLEIILQKGKKNIYKAYLHSDPFHPITIDEQINEYLPNVTILPPDRRRTIDVRALSELNVKKKLNTVIKILKIIEPRIKDISLVQIGNASDIYVDIGLVKKMPIKMMGDGMIHLLSIILAMSRSADGILLIDEIENGLYYATTPSIWQGIYEAAVIFNCQIIASTHSYECLEAAFNAIPSKQIEQFNYIRLERKKEKIKAEEYDCDELKWAFERNVEVR